MSSPHRKESTTPTDPIVGSPSEPTAAVGTAGRWIVGICAMLAVTACERVPKREELPPLTAAEQAELDTLLRYHGIYARNPGVRDSSLFAECRVTTLATRFDTPSIVKLLAHLKFWNARDSVSERIRRADAALSGLTLDYGTCVAHERRLAAQRTSP
jgi:hypothetical protein